MPMPEIVLIISILLAIAVIAAGLLRDVPIPDSVILVVIGIVLGELAGRVDWLAPLASFRLTRDLVFFVLLPVLIFEAGYNLNARQLVKDIVPILALAVPALLISTALIGVGIHLLLGLDLLTALLFGALISATDPVAVIALFKELGAPLRLTVLVEGESLLNDATAIVVFGIVLGLVVSGAELTGAALLLSVLKFLWVFVGGGLVGLALGAVIGEIVYRLRTALAGVLAMSVVAAYASFIVAEHLLHVSGVMASASAAVTLGALTMVRMPQSATATVGELWEMLALICNALLFLLVGLSVDIEGLVGRIPAIAAAIPLVLAAPRGVGLRLDPDHHPHPGTAAGEPRRAAHHVVGRPEGWARHRDRPVDPGGSAGAPAAARSHPRGGAVHLADQRADHPSPDGEARPRPADRGGARGAQPIAGRRATPRDRGAGALPPRRLAVERG